MKSKKIKKLTIEKIKKYKSEKKVLLQEDEEVELQKEKQVFPYKKELSKPPTKANPNNSPAITSRSQGEPGRPLQEPAVLQGVGWRPRTGGEQPKREQRRSQEI